MERSLRALVSTRTTQLPPTVAMRAREVAAPNARDLARAEQELVIVRRFYVPPAPLAAGKTASEPSASREQRTDARRGGRRPTSGGAD